jgi:hypothetical protein
MSVKIWGFDFVEPKMSVPREASKEIDFVRLLSTMAATKFISM